MDKFTYKLHLGTNQADNLGAILAIKAELEKLEKETKKSILESGVTELDGTLFHIAVVTAERETVDTKAVKTVLTPEELAIVLKKTTVVSVRCNSR